MFGDKAAGIAIYLRLDPSQFDALDQKLDTLIGRDQAAMQALVARAQRIAQQLTVLAANLEKLTKETT